VRRRRDLLVLAIAAGLVSVVTLGPLVAELIQIVCTPPQHPELVVMGIVGDALERLVWSVGVAAVVLVLRVVASRIRPRLTRKSRRTRSPHLWRERLAQTRQHLARRSTRLDVRDVARA
jgi:uncharacterized membrane protein